MMGFTTVRRGHAFGRRIVNALLASSMALAAATPVLANEPHTGGEPVGDDSVLPLSQEQIDSRALKEALIRQVPARTPRGQPRRVIEDRGGPTDGTTQASTASTPSHGYILNADPRQQIKWYFCGPAVVQVASNWSWRMAKGTNKYTQQQISDWWTRTDANGQTFLGDFINGMNRASRLPSGFVYMQKHRPTFIDWHRTIVSGVYDWKMHLAAGVIPRKDGARYWLVSWNVISNGGHYIDLYGYVGLPEEAERWVYFSDTAGIYASSQPGNYKQGSYAVYQTMMYNNGNMVY